MYSLRYQPMYKMETEDMNTANVFDRSNRGEETSKFQMEIPLISPIDNFHRQYHQSGRSHKVRPKRASLEDVNTNEHQETPLHYIPNNPMAPLNEFHYSANDQTTAKEMSKWSKRYNESNKSNYNSTANNNNDNINNNNNPSSNNNNYRLRMHSASFDNDNTYSASLNEIRGNEV